MFDALIGLLVLIAWLIPVYYLADIIVSAIF